MTKTRKLTYAALLSGMLAMSPYAQADDDHGKRSHGREQKSESRYHFNDDDDRDGQWHIRRNSNPAYIIIDNRDRVIINDYLDRDYHGRCPPGLAKKHNGCQPPGHAKRYVVGRPLPDYVTYHPVPHDLLVRLQPVPSGYRYVKVDTDVLLIAEASKKVIDAVTLLSAVGN